MNKLQLLSIPIVLTLATACGAGMSEEPIATESEEPAATEAADTARVSYSVGWQTGQSFVQQQIEIDQENLVQGLSDALEGVGSKWSDQEMMAALQQLQQQVASRQQQMAQEQAGANAAAASEFLASNGGREGVTTLPSGLQYEVITAGDGEKPLPTDTVSVHYRGTLVDGTEFDSSYSRGTPATFPLNRVIPGWTEGLQLMSVGSKWKLFLPSELGYGMRGSPPKIGPAAALVFEVELLEIAE